jgi:hypothetical protein
MHAAIAQLEGQVSRERLQALEQRLGGKEAPASIRPAEEEDVQLQRRSSLTGFDAIVARASSPAGGSNMSSGAAAQGAPGAHAQHGEALYELDPGGGAVKRRKTSRPQYRPPSAMDATHASAKDDSRAPRDGSKQQPASASKPYTQAAAFHSPVEVGGGKAGAVGAAPGARRQQRPGGAGATPPQAPAPAPAHMLAPGGHMTPPLAPPPPQQPMLVDQNSNPLSPQAAGAWAGPASQARQAA